MKNFAHEKLAMQEETLCVARAEDPLLGDDETMAYYNYVQYRMALFMVEEGGAIEVRNFCYLHHMTDKTSDVMEWIHNGPEHDLAAGRAYCLLVCMNKQCVKRALRLRGEGGMPVGAASDDEEDRGRMVFLGRGRPIRRNVGLGPARSMEWFDKPESEIKGNALRKQMIHVRVLRRRILMQREAFLHTQMAAKL